MGPSVHVLAKKYKQMAFTEVVSPSQFQQQSVWVTRTQLLQRGALVEEGKLCITALRYQ